MPNGATAAFLPPPLLISTGVLVMANLIPLAGVLLGYWSSYEIILLFWAENVVVGLLQILRMATVLVLRRERAMAFLIPFFTLHYGLFSFVHGEFVVALFGPAGLAGGLGDAVGLLLAWDGLLWPLLGLLVSHLVSYALNFLAEGEWRDIEPKALMKQPYGRVIMLHLVVIAGGFLALALGSPVYVLVLLVLAKIAADLRAHWAQHRAGAAAPDSAGVVQP